MVVDEEEAEQFEWDGPCGTDAGWAQKPGRSRKSPGLISVCCRDLLNSAQTSSSQMQMLRTAEEGARQPGASCWLGGASWSTEISHKRKGTKNAASGRGGGSGLQGRNAAPPSEPQLLLTARAKNKGLGKKNPSRLALLIPTHCRAGPGQRCRAKERKAEVTSASHSTLCFAGLIWWTAS